MKHIFADTQHRSKTYGVECDVFIPSLNFAIEVDGRRWHRDKREADRKKNEHLARRGIILTHLRERGIGKISTRDLMIESREADYSVVSRLLRHICTLPSLTRENREKVRQYLRKRQLTNEEGYRELIAHLPGPPPNRSLGTLFPIVAKEWHPKNNGSVSPDKVHPSSNHKFWWRCSRGHEWQATPGHRVSGQGCPYCIGKRVSDENALATLNPQLAKQWHPTKNGHLTAHDVTLHSNKPIWWVCKQGHEWVAPPNRRAKGAGCPYCYGRFATKENNLAAKYPRVAKQWHPSKNGGLMPETITPHCSRKVWWACGKGHKWQAVVGNRTRLNQGCPHCARLKRAKRARRPAARRQSSFGT